MWVISYNYSYASAPRLHALPVTPMANLFTHSNPPAPGPRWPLLRNLRRPNAASKTSYSTTVPQARRPHMLDSLRGTFWDAYRHLFPPHAVAAQTDSGCIVVSWSMADDPHARNPHAAPVMIRLEQDLIETAMAAGQEACRRMAAQLEPQLRAGMVGYDPYAAFKVRIVVLG